MLDTGRSSPLATITRKYERVKQFLIRTVRLGTYVKDEAGEAMVDSKWAYVMSI